MGEPLRNANLDHWQEDLQAYAIDVFGATDAALQWLDTPLWELDDLSPREIVRIGKAGFERARDVLLRIEYGVYS